MGESGYWGLALGLGLVAAVAVTVLLEMFYRQVRRVERGAEQVWRAGKEVAANTATTWLLSGTSERLDLLAEEADRHVALLAPKGRRGR